MLRRAASHHLLIIRLLPGLCLCALVADGTVCASLLVLRSASRTHTVRWLGVLVVSFALPCIVLKLHGGR